MATASYFLPPVEAATSIVRGTFATRRYDRQTPKFRQLFFGTRRGRDVWITPGGVAYLDQAQGEAAGGIKYRGGTWNGPLTSAQVSAITTAGYAARIATVDDTRLGTDLPGWIDG